MATFMRMTPCGMGMGVAQLVPAAVEAITSAKTFDDVVSDNIELRLCGDESHSTKDCPVTLVELYIQ